jgi:hypothetical protein
MVDAAKWKLALGVDPELIEDAHGMDIDYSKI